MKVISMPYYNSTLNKKLSLKPDDIYFNRCGNAKADDR